MDLQEQTDDDLVRTAADGDRASLSTVFDRFAPTVTRYAWALATTRVDVEEIVQDTFVTFWQKAPDLDVSESSLLPWLLVTCRNHALNHRRKRIRHEGDELPPDLAAPEDPAEARERLRWVRDEIAALSAIDQRVCELCLIEGRPYAEAAEILGITVTAVTQRVSRSRARLRKAVTNREQ